MPALIVKTYTATKMKLYSVGVFDPLHIFLFL